MPTHSIEVELPAHSIVNTDLNVRITSDGEMLGTLSISKGTIDWRPTKWREAIKVRWETFDRMMRDRAAT